MTIKGIICDFGGVLVLFNDQGARMKWATRLGIDHDKMADVLFNSKTSLDALTGRITEEELWQSYKDQFGLSPEEFVLFREDIFKDDRFNVELVSYISHLPATLKKTILSNAWSDARSVFTLKYHLDDVFNLIIISAEEGIAKPDGELFIRTAERMDLKPWELLFIDDILDNAQAAAKVGMAAIHFKDTDSTIRQVTTLLKSQGVIGS